MVLYTFNTFHIFCVIYNFYFREFKTAEPIHLFQALHNAAVQYGAISQYGNFSVVDYYKTWTEQNGHPLLFVEVNHKTGQMTITQVFSLFTVICPSY